MSDIFISYARPTAAQAHRVAEALRNEGFEVWLDDELPAHRPFSEVIEERLRQAKAVVVVWSEAAAKSQWVRSEANFAREENKLVQLSVDGARLPLPFDQIQCPDLSRWSGDVSALGWQSVLSSVSALTGVARPGAPARAAPEAAEDASVAVLPFRDLSPERDQDYFCEGAAEEILCALAELPGIRVAGRAAAFLFKDEAPESRELGRLLNVATFLEGSVRKSGDRVRVSVRLVNAKFNTAVWAKTFERHLTDIFAVQEEIARAIVEALNVTLLDTDAGKLRRRGTQNIKAYDLYLRGRQLMRRELETERRTAAELFREAARLDPRFALAYAGLADALIEIARRRLGDTDAVRTEALQASERAIELGPDLPEAQIARGNALHLQNDPAAEAAFQRALALSPQSAELHYAWAKFLVMDGRRREAIVHYERAFELAPDDYRYIVFAVQEYQAIGDREGERSCLERSWAAIERRLEIDPEDVRAYDHGAGVLALLGRKAEASRFVDKALAFGRDDYGTLYTLACAAMLNDEPDRALDLLDQAVANGRGDKAWLLNDNDLAPLHGHPRFEAIVQRMA